MTAAPLKTQSARHVSSKAPAQTSQRAIAPSATDLHQTEPAIIRRWLQRDIFPLVTEQPHR
ncbi:hypothetical protein [Rhizobium sp. 18055]|uniref:hypothetical protein n=1 Tax=Rhizobium sp. 18055 TaxID=2681403 RepID=UPI00135C9369|nr:hypothetical protein [Rhizobium sp. 18055]